MVISSLLVALAFTILEPAAQVAGVSGAGVGGAGEIRSVLRETSAGAEQAPPPRMTLVPGGSTAVGTDPARVASVGQNDPTQMTQVLGETPRHTQAVDTFFIDNTEVTNLQWKVFLDATGRKPSAILVRYGWPDGTIPAGQEQFPVANVNAADVRDYLQWCGKRLPTEAEWTRAARGDDEREWPWGDAWDARKCLSGPTVSVQPVRVGNYPAGASPYGVLDLAGNVFEWTDSPFTAFDGFQPVTFGSGRGAIELAPEFSSSLRVVKGGAFSGVKRLTRIDARFSYAPTNSDAALGFRGARSALDGLDSLHRGLRRLLPPKLAEAGQLDERDVFGRELTEYDELRRVITRHRCLAFAHGAAPAPPLAKLRLTAKDDPLLLGILVTTEPLLLGSGKPGDQALALPAAEYTLAFKSAGESRKHKEKRRAEQQASAGRSKGPAAAVAVGRGRTSAGSVPDAGAAAGSGPSAGSGAASGGGEFAGGGGSTGGDAASPASRVASGSIHDIGEDIEFDQDVDAILFLNANEVVVGWSKALSPTEGEPAPIAVTGSDSGRAWRIDFALRQAGGKKADRFTLELKLAGGGLE